MRTFDEIAARLSDARSCGSTLRGTCPACGGGNLSLTRYGSDLGWLKCFNCDTAGADLLRAVAGEPVKVAVPIARRQVSADERTARARALWREAQPIEGTIAESYLRARAIAGPLPATLKFHQGIWHAEAKRYFPAMVGAVCEPDRTLTGVHCTYLDPASGGKAKVEPTKKMFGSMRGCSVHLDRITDGTLAISEGIETGLAFQLLWDIPTWACLSTSGLLTFEPPPGIKRIIIAGDADANGRGQDAAAAAHDRIEQLYPDIDVELDMPDAGLDWADVLASGDYA